MGMQYRSSYKNETTTIVKWSSWGIIIIIFNCNESTQKEEIWANSTSGILAFLMRLRGMRWRANFKKKYKKKRKRSLHFNSYSCLERSQVCQVALVI